MHYADIKYFDIANGPGIRTTLFVSGCNHRCPGCFNEVAWSFDYGEEFTPDVEDKLIEALSDPACQGLTLLGGEPMDPKNQPAVLSFVRKFKEKLPNKDIWCFTGYLFDKDILDNMMKNVPETKELLGYIDVLVDGPFIMAKKDVTLLYKGSSNQRTIDVKKSLATGTIEQWNPGDNTIVSKTAHL